MLQKGPARKVTIYLNQDTRHHLQPLWVAIFDYLHHKRIAGANVWVPHVGFGGHGRVRKTEAAEVPEPTIRIEFIDTAERIEEVLPTLYDMVTDGLIEVQDTTVVKAVRKEKPLAERRRRQRKEGPAKVMRIFLGEADTLDGEPLYEAIVKRLRMMDVGGATVYKGILGYGAKGHTHKAGMLHFSRDLPIMISVVDSEEKIKEASEAVEAMLGDGLIVLSDVDRIRLTHEPEGKASPNADRSAS
jgi:PII-like signaling protein